MLKKRIYIVDNILIYTGLVVLAVCFLLLYAMAGDISSEIRIEQIANMLAIPLKLLGAALLFLFVGKMIRNRERDIISVWNLIENSIETTAHELEYKTGFSRKFIRQAVILVNKKKNVVIEWDEETDIIIDRRHSISGAAVTACGGCGADITQLSTLEQGKKPQCSGCGANVSKEQFERLRRIRYSFKGNPKEEFSMAVFLFLTLTIPPAGITYAALKSGIFKDPYA